MSHGDSWKHEELPRQSRLESSAVASCRLLLSNVFYEVSEAELALLFEQVGPLQSKPSIRYDKSGRSLGTATVTYLELPHAIKAYHAFNNAPAKGQPLKIQYDSHYKQPPAPGSLEARLAPVELPSKERNNPFNATERQDRNKPRTSTGNTPRGSISSRGTSLSTRGAPRGGSTRTQSNRGRDGKGAPKREPNEKKEPKSATDLDRELDLFMAQPIAKVDVAAGGDVQMS